MKFIKNSRNNRVFCDSLLRTVAVEILLGGKIDENLQLPSYKKLNPEFATGRHGGFSFVPISEKVSTKEIETLQKIIEKGYKSKFQTIRELVEFMESELGIESCHTQVLNDLDYTLELSKKRQLKQMKH